MARWCRTLALLAALALLVGACGRGGGGEGQDARWQQEIVIGWTPPDITGVFKTATEFFEKAANEANAAGFKVKVESRSPATHTAFADQVAIIDDFVSRKVDVIAISPADTEAIKPAVQRANEANIPVIIVNLLGAQDDIEVASYIGFDNSEAASVSAYAVLDYFGGPGVLGSGPKVDVQPDQYLDLEWWQGVYQDADPAEIRGSGAIIEGIAGTFFSQERLDGFHEGGWFGTQFAVQLACGQQVPKTQDIRPRTVWQGNADQFYPDIALPAIDWNKI